MPRAKTAKHLRVAHIVPCGKHHPFSGQRFYVSVLPDLGHRALHAPIFLPQQFHNRRRKQALRQPSLHQHLHVPLEHRDMRRPNPGGRLIALKAFRTVLKALRCWTAPRLYPTLCSFRRDLRRRFQYRDVGIAFQIPIKRLAGLLCPTAQDVLAHLICHIPHQVVDDLDLIHVAATPNIRHTAVHYGKITRTRLWSLTFFQQEHCAAQLRAAARAAATPASPAPTTTTSASIVFSIRLLQFPEACPARFHPHKVISSSSTALYPQQGTILLFIFSRKCSIWLYAYYNGNVPFWTDDHC